MYFYWRIQQDLNCLGEVIVFHHPGLIRSFRQWVKRNATGLALAQDIDLPKLLRTSLN